MSCVVELPGRIYVATRTTTIPVESEVRTRVTPSPHEIQFTNACSALNVALDDELPVVPSHTTIDEALALLEMLPPKIWPPEPVIEDSGTIAWVWDRWPGKVLALAVDGTGKIQRSAFIDGQQSCDTTTIRDRLHPKDLELLMKFSPANA